MPLFFEKSLDEIYEIVVNINEEIQTQLDQNNFVNEPESPVSFQFNDFAGWFCWFNDILIDSENKTGWDYDESIDEYEDISVSVKRLIQEKIDKYKTLKL